MEDYRGARATDAAVGAPTRGAGLQPLPSLPPLYDPSPPGPRPEARPVPELISPDLTYRTKKKGRLGKGALALVVAALVVMGGAAGGVLAFRSAASPPLIQSPADANGQLFAAANSSGSFHYVSVASGTIDGKNVSGTQTGQVTRGEGVQFMTSNVGDYEVVVVNAQAYMKADLAALETNLGYTAAEAAPYVERWIQFGPTDPPYNSVASGVTTESIWGVPSESPGDQLPQTPQSVSGASTVDGRSVQTVTYLLHGSKTATKTTFTGTEQISFSTAAPHLPYAISEHLSGSSGGQSASYASTITFSQWGAPVSVTAPTSPVPFSSLPPPGTAA